MMITIKREWLDQCGYQHIMQREYRVIEVLPHRLPDGRRIFVVDLNGRPWHVAEWRCETITD